MNKICKILSSTVRFDPSSPLGSVTVNRRFPVTNGPKTLRFKFKKPSAETLIPVRVLSATKATSHIGGKDVVP